MKKITRKEAEEIAARINDWIEAEEKRAKDENDVTKFESAICEVADDFDERGWDFKSALSVGLRLWGAHDRHDEDYNYWVFDEVRGMMDEWGDELEDCGDGCYTAVIPIESTAAKEVQP